MPHSERDIGFLMKDVAQLMRRNFLRRAQGVGLSQAQWRALAYLSRQQGVKQVTLAESLEIQPITLVRQIDRLEESGLVERRLDPDDRRAFRLHLTDKAQPLLEMLWNYAAEMRADAFTGMTPETRRMLIDTLLAMKENLIDAEGISADTDVSEKRNSG